MEIPSESGDERPFEAAWRRRQHDFRGYDRIFRSDSRFKVAAAAPIGGPFTLIDHDGKAVSNRNFLGRPFLVFFGYTHCQDVCPLMLFELSEVLRALGSEAKIQAIFVTVDPERDTPTHFERLSCQFRFAYRRSLWRPNGDRSNVAILSYLFEKGCRKRAMTTLSTIRRSFI